MADKHWGRWAYLIGLLLAAVLAFMPGLFGGLVSTSILLVVIGLLVGYMNVKASEEQRVMLAIIGLPVVLAALNSLGTVSSIVGPLFTNIIAFAGGAGIVVFIRALHGGLKD